MGELETSSVVRVMRSLEFVLRLSWLGFRFMGAIMGLMKDGDAGSDISDEEPELEGGWMESPFIFLRRLGPGEVMGRSWLGPERVRRAMLDRPPKEAGAKLGRWPRLTGESGDEEGEGSERSEQSVMETVVVGDESADSVICVDVLSLCLWADSDVRAPGPAPGCESPGSFPCSKTNLWLTIVMGLDWSMSLIPLSTS
jgi:hypothetical protein